MKTTYYEPKCSKAWQIEDLDEYYRKKIYEAAPDLKKIKKNPDNWPIIHKYNNRIFQRAKFVIFPIIEEAIEIRIKQRMEEIFDN